MCLGFLWIAFDPSIFSLCRHGSVVAPAEFCFLWIPITPQPVIFGVALSALRKQPVFLL